jgi:HD-GYP domain-containing protein (c-di-GMP phosphodiesterase class II)
MNALERRWQEMAEELRVPARTMKILGGTLARLEAHHLPTSEHCKRVGILAVRIGLHAGIPPKPLFYSGSLHDFGKLNVSPELLSKTTEWTEEDALALRDHPEAGYEALLEVGMPVTAGLVVRHHSFQPKNYPEVLPAKPTYMADSFDYCARVLALADYYDAAHRPNLDVESTDEEIRIKMLTHNPDAVDLVSELYESGVFGSE